MSFPIWFMILFYLRVLSVPFGTWDIEDATLFLSAGSWLRNLEGGGGGLWRVKSLVLSSLSIHCTASCFFQVPTGNCSFWFPSQSSSSDWGGWRAINRTESCLSPFSYTISVTCTHFVLARSSLLDTVYIQQILNAFEKFDFLIYAEVCQFFQILFSNAAKSG